MKSILMIAYHYPPIRGSSGVQRTLKFSYYLREHGWKPAILTAHPRAYPEVGEGQTSEIPEDTLVRRAFALDAAKHLSLGGRYLKLLALPDRWSSWWFGGLYAGLGMIRRHRPHVLWSTYPIATAHLIGLTLHRLTGIPWVADFRDPMTEGDYPPDKTLRRQRRRIEGLTVKHCSQAVFTAPGTIQMYAQRYPEIPSKRWALIRNGYDEENFVRAEQLTARRASQQPAVLVHSGLLYPSERDPRALFGALGDLLRAEAIGPMNLKVILRGSGEEDYHRNLIREHGIESIVFLEPRVSYDEALAEMLAADGLLVLQASNCNRQIPAKIYEYLRARRPILALTDPSGDTASLLREVGVGKISPLDSKKSITGALLEFLQEIRQGRSPIATGADVRRHSREERTRELAMLLERLTERKPDATD